MMKEIIHACITVQCKYSDLPLQDRIYIAFGRVVTGCCDGTDEIEYIITNIKSEFEFLEGVWNGKDGKG